LSLDFYFCMLCPFFLSSIVDPALCPIPTLCCLPCLSCEPLQLLLASRGGLAIADGLSRMFPIPVDGKRGLFGLDVTFLEGYMNSSSRSSFWMPALQLSQKVTPALPSIHNWPIL
jgi:hypothetical protein